jgi:predicted DNA-binding ribbon-helix-helix protein
MKSRIIKRSVIVRGHKTSISLEDAFWSGLKEIAQAGVRRWRRRLQKSTRRANREICRRRFACLYSATLAIRK